jgi:threonyl-tRNA synthetase
MMETPTIAPTSRANSSDSSHARPGAQHERRAHLLHAGAVRRCTFIAHHSARTSDSSVFSSSYYAGNFPLWLAPDQVRVLTLNDDAALVDYAKPIVNELRANFVRCEADFGTDPIKAKIAGAEKAKVHTMLVIGGRDMDAGNVSVRLHGKDNLGTHWCASAFDTFAVIHYCRIP